MSKRPCRRNGCPDVAAREYRFCSPLCRWMEVQVRYTNRDKNVSQAELSALQDLVASLNAWRTVVMADK